MKIGYVVTDYELYCAIYYLALYKTYVARTYALSYMISSCLLGQYDTSLLEVKFLRVPLIIITQLNSCRVFFR